MKGVLRILNNQNGLPTEPRPKKRLLGSNLSVPKGIETKSLAKTQYDKVMENFEKDAKSNAQKIRECLERENNRKVVFKKMKKKELQKQVKYFPRCSKYILFILT